MLNNVLKKIVGTKNERELRRIQPLVARVNELEPRMKSLADDEFPRLTAQWKEEVQHKGRSLEELLPEVPASRKSFGIPAEVLPELDHRLRFIGLEGDR